MADNHYGVYVSIRTPSGLLWSSSRETWVEVQTDVVDAFGEEYLESFIREVLGEPTAKSAVGQVVEAFDATVVQAAPTAAPSEAAAPDEVPQFEKCDVCGSLKDRWVPPGTNKKTGKTYPGFFGCSNFQNHRR